MFSLSLLLLAAATTLASADDVFYEWTIRPRLSVPPFSPDCYTDRDLLLVEDQLPGPTLRANVGDKVHIRWHNHHPSEGVTIHYHGLLMKDQPYADHTSGISTCVVGPMQTFEHMFVADNAGTHYWHGHTSLDRMDGLQGLIVIEDPNDPDEQALKEMYDEERVLFLQDWYHKSGSSLRTSLDSGVWIGFPQSILINGKGRYDPCVEDATLPGCAEEGCSVEDYVPAIAVEAGKTYLFRIINAGGLMPLNLAIANHTMQVVQADGTFVKPVEVPSLEVNLAQRYSVLVSADQTDDMSYWMAAESRGNAGFAFLQYGGNSTEPPSVNATMPDHDLTGLALDGMLLSKNISTHPNADILDAAVTPDRSSVIVSAQTMYRGQMKYTSNNVSNTMHSPKPLAAVAYQAVNDAMAAPWPDTLIPGTVLVPEAPAQVWNFSNTPREEGVSASHSDHGLAVVQYIQGDVVEMVFQNIVGNRGSAGTHAWHLHGHEFYIVGQGRGTFQDEDRASFNLQDPLLRDTFSVWSLGWTAIRFKADNPGVWPLHCTMAPHSVTGMGFSVITSPDLLTAPPPGLVTCTMTSVNPKDAQVCMPASDYMNFTLETEVDRLGDIEEDEDVSASKAGATDGKEGAENNSAGSGWLVGWNQLVTLVVVELGWACWKMA